MIYSKNFDPKKAAEERKEELKDITEKLEKGVQDVFASDQYQKLLDTMARFPRYSLNNNILIMLQKPDATLVQSYTGWKKMGRFVKKGEKGIRILAPAPYKLEKEQDKVDESGKVVLDKDGEAVKEKDDDAVVEKDLALNQGEMLLLAIATSIDALAVGIMFAFTYDSLNIYWAIAIIGLTTFVLSIIGVIVGNFFGNKYKKKSEIAGGIILILIGVKILLEHLGIISF